LVSVGRLKNGILYNHIVNWTTPFKERKMIITGEKGVLEIDMLKADLIIYENGIKQVNYKELTLFKGVSLGNIINYAFEKNEPLVTEHLQFQELILSGVSSSVALLEGAINLKVAECFLESARDKKIVKISYDN
jgi:predicted dehydrogenase